LITHFVEFLCDAEAHQEVPGTQVLRFHANKKKESDQSSDFALLVDCRVGNAFPHIGAAIDQLRAAGVSVSLLFLDCQDEVVVRRFRETRRPHPLHISEAGSFLQTIAEALVKERELLADFRDSADRVIDTSTLTPHQLRAVIEDFCGQRQTLRTIITSFGFKYGSPTDVDLLIDVRFLPNPYFVEDLRPLTGKDQSVSDYVFETEDAKEFFRRYLSLLEFLIPRYQKEGKRYLTIGVGCTGGRHRSVAVSLALKEELKQRGIAAQVKHRDLAKAGRSGESG